MAKMSRISLARKKELDEPDQVLAFLIKVTNFVVENKNRVIGGVGALIAVFVIIVGVVSYGKKSEIKAFTQLAAVSSATTVGSSVPAESTEALKNQYRSLYETRPGTIAGKLAGFYYANICYDNGDMDTAISIYEKLSKKFKGQPLFRQRALSSLGYAYETAGDLDQARACFEKIVTAPAFAFKDKALFNLARLYGQTGDSQKSRELLATLASDYPDSMYADFAREKSGGVSAESS
jgi:tetratricopeptide (TPR) repeat protein